MKQQYKGWFAFFLLVVLLTSTIFTAPVKAATLGIDSISPTIVVNDVNNQININGHNFPDQSKVTIGSEAAVVTSFSATLLIVRVPAGFAPGDYSVTVTDPNDATNFDSRPNALHVFAPTPTPIPSPTPMPGRPQIVIDQTTINVHLVRYGQDFTLNVSLDNAGGSTAWVSVRG